MKYLIILILLITVSCQSKLNTAYNVNTDNRWVNIGELDGCTIYKATHYPHTYWTICHTGNTASVTN